MKNWQFSSEQLLQLKQLRQTHIPMNYSFDEEQALLDYRTLLLLDLLKNISQEQQLQVFSYSCVLFKRFYLRFSVFEQSEQQQFGLVCTYLAMKLNEIPHKSIQEIAEVLKKKQKHKDLIHFGDDKYAKIEMILVQSLNYHIDVKPIYPVLLSYNYALKLADHLKPFLFDVYMKQVVVFFLRAIKGHLIFQHSVGIIALCIVECSLQFLLQQLQLPSGSSIVGGTNRPVEQKDQQKLKELHTEHLSRKRLVIQLLLQLEAPSKVAKQKDVYDKELQNEVQEQINKHTSELNEIIELLNNTKDIPRQFEKELQKYKLVKMEQFPRPQSVSRPNADIDMLDSISKQIKYS